MKKKTTVSKKIIPGGLHKLFTSEKQTGTKQSNRDDNSKAKLENRKLNDSKSHLGVTPLSLYQYLTACKHQGETHGLLFTY